MAQIAGDRAMAAASQLEKIGFVDFTVDLVKGVYEVIVKASMDQLMNYAELVSQVSKDLASYQADMIGADGSEELKAKVDSYIKDVLELAPDSASDYTLATEKAGDLQIHFSGIELEDTSTTPPTKKEFQDVLIKNNNIVTLKVADLKNFVEAKLKAGVAHSRDLLISILKIGMQKVVVTNGEIETKLTFHVDASDESSKNRQRSNQKSSGWGIGGSVSGSVGGVAGKLLGAACGAKISGGYSSRKLSVSVINQKSSAATNVQIDILGHVRILFRTETFPTVEI